MSISEKLDAARLRAGVWMRERAERAEVRRSAKEARRREIGFDQVPARIRFAVMLATWAVVGFLILWVTQITGVLQLDAAIDWAVDRPLRFDWDLRANLNILPLIVLAIVSFAIVAWSKTWVSYFASTPWRDWFSKWGSLVLGIGGSAAIVLGGFEVNQNTRAEDYRGALVEQQSAEQGRAALEAQIQSIDERLAAMRNQERVGVYAAIAATVGTAAYDENYLSAEALARTQPDRRDIVRRARGAAVSADALETQRLALVAQRAAATPAAATEATVQMTDPVSRFIAGMGAWRIVILVLVSDLILLFGLYFADKHEERSRYASSSRASGWASDAERIEDLRDQEPVAAQSPVPLREDIVDADTGERLTRVKPHLRKVRPRKGVPQKVEIRPEPEPDERGVTVDGGQRIGTGNLEQLTDLGTVQPVNKLEPNPINERRDGETAEKANPETEYAPELQQDEPPSVDELTDEEVAAIEAELAVTSDGDPSESGSPSPYGDGSDNRSEAQDESSEHDSHEPESNGIFVHDSSPSENNEQPDHADGENSASQEAEGDNEEQGEPGFQYAEDETGPVKPRGLIAAE